MSNESIADVVAAMRDEAAKWHFETMMHTWMMLFANRVEAAAQRDWNPPALSDPPRNCDRFATWEEAYKAFDKWCEDGSGCKGGKLSCAHCAIRWLFAPATEGSEKR